MGIDYEFSIWGEKRKSVAEAGEDNDAVSKKTRTEKVPRALPSDHPSFPP